MDTIGDLACGVGGGELMDRQYCLPGLGYVGSLAQHLAWCPSVDRSWFWLGLLQNWTNMELVICIYLDVLGYVVGFWLVFSLIQYH